MDYYTDDASAIDRAFGSDATGVLGSGNVDAAGHGDVNNTSAPVPRKRPTATPATTVASSKGPATAASSVSTINDSTSSAAAPVSMSGNRQDHAQGLQQQMHELRQQLADGMASKNQDPAQTAAMYQRMTGLMSELQTLMHQIAPAGGSTGSPTTTSPTAAASAQQQQQQQQQSSMAASSPTMMAAEETSGLRRNARPFEPSSAGVPQMAPTAPYYPTGGGRGGYHAGYGIGGPMSNMAPYGARGGMNMYAPGGYGAPQMNAYGARAPGWGMPGQPVAPRPAGCVLCFVEFKRGRMKRFESDMFIAPGNYIIVDGDRGEDCGLVVHTFQRLPDGSIGRTETLEGVNIDVNKVKPETGRVRRIADDSEVDRLHGDIATLERHALKTCRERVEAMGLNMDVVDCEYQFDRKKITFFFDAPVAIDFRELTKDLFKHFGARIWLENINSKVKNVVPEGALSHADKLLYAERGLRPPRR